MSSHCCKKNKKEPMRKSADSFVIGIIMVTFVLLGAVVYFGAKIGSGSQVAADARVSVVIEENKFDWGTIDIEAGVVSHTFVIENTSDTTLKLYNVKTSCACTSAQLISGENRSQKFDMHSKSASVFEVEANQSAQLLVEFDPMFHGPSGVGPIDRVVTLESNDPVNPTLTFGLTAEVVRNK